MSLTSSYKNVDNEPIKGILIVFGSLLVDNCIFIETSPGLSERKEVLNATLNDSDDAVF